MKEIGIIICDGHASDLEDLVSLRRSQGWTIGEYVYFEPVISKLHSREIRNARIFLEGEMVGACLGTAAAISLSEGASEVFFDMENVRTGGEVDTIAQRLIELRAILVINDLEYDPRIKIRPKKYDWR